ncbi:MAG: hypothetical protein ACI4R9_03980 [Kiritimatiellia bacterium]
MKQTPFATIAAVTAVLAASAAQDPIGWNGSPRQTLTVSADRMAADNFTGDVVATGHVRAVTSPLGIARDARPTPICLLSDFVEKKGDEYRFADGTTFSTCTNDAHACHWSASGEVVYREARGIVARNMTLRLFGRPILWLPYWYYPLDTDYGLRISPGYSSRWGGYLLTKYVYHLAGDFGPDAWGLDGSSRVDWRSENGIAIGQGFRWQLGSLGRGRFKAYYAWDQDADTYDHHWTSGRHWHYENWGSKVPDERYGLLLEHRWDATERDVVRLKGAYYSDSYFRSDFLRDGLFGARNRFLGHEGNELAWEHVENAFGFGVSVSGPLNDFYGGTARLPEAFFDIAPQPLFGLPLNYESSSRLGFLNRNYARHGTTRTAVPFRYDPGAWADYSTFRLDTYHRLTLPFKVADIVSVVPRVGVRGTYWERTGFENLDGYGRAGNTGDDALRTIVEGGVTFNARGTAWLNEDWQHLIEPYLDVLAQEADYSGLGRGQRPYVFDSIDASSDYLDQFAGRSRNLPYTWYGVTPGVRNALRQTDEKGRLRTILDLDVYAAVQFNDTEWTRGNRYHRLAAHPEDPNYGKDCGTVMPGLRVRWLPADDIALLSRVEFDTENDTVAYADVSWRQLVSRDFRYAVTYFGRDHRHWDYSSTPFEADGMRNEDFNWNRFGYLEVSCEHDLCDAVAWGPFVRWDCRESELDEIGTWLDLRTDCLGFRFSFSYENDYRRIDGSKSDDDWRFGFYVYLRALGPESGSAF